MVRSIPVSHCGCAMTIGCMVCFQMRVIAARMDTRMKDMALPVFGPSLIVLAAMSTHRIVGQTMKAWKYFPILSGCPAYAVVR